MNRLRRSFVLAGFALPALVCAADVPALPQPDDIDALLARAQRERKALMAVFTRHDCPFCIALKREELQWLARDAEARHLILAEIDVGVERPLRVSGAPINRLQFARRFGGQFTPTIVFLGPGYVETAPRLVGYGNPFYSAYLEDRIEQAVKATGRAAAKR
ncbi:MAG: thioredoxin fold domain-containing protein [Burkholderiales bacterium]|nr:MAG: thioredoxin fold domain-containing protein [Burkholderiales bacterium]